MTEARTCPACGGGQLETLYALEAIPVQSCILLPSRTEAEQFPTAPLLLKACDACGFLFNALFEPARIDYAAATEESQNFSGTFNHFAESLIEEIAELYDLGDRLTLEIGCGKGEFLLALRRRTGTRGFGIDPGFLPERLPEAAGDADLRFHRAYFDLAEAPAPDFIVCRHTLEHVPDVAEFVSGVARLADDRPEVGVFFETPDVGRVLEEGGFWDIYHEHCSYFTPGSHARLFRTCGLAVTRLKLDYDGQYIIQHAAAGAGAPLPIEDDLDRLRALIRAFPERVAAHRAQWRNLVRRRAASGERVALWGGGSKAVAFLTTLGLGAEVAQVVDINPHKQGRFLPGTGHEVIAPARLVPAPPDLVIAMNPVYVGEIGADLTKLGLAPEIVAL